LIGIAVFGVGTPLGLIAVIGAVSWKIVCASLVPKNRVPEVPADQSIAQPLLFKECSIDTTPRSEAIVQAS
jgi:hypothetical protein